MQTDPTTDLGLFVRLAPVREPPPAMLSRLDLLLARYRWLVLTLLSLATFTAGVLGLRLAREPASWLESLGYAYESLRLFTLNGTDQRTSTPLYHLARFAAPLVTLGAVATAFTGIRRELRLLRFRRARNHVVVLGVGTKGGRVALDSLGRGARVVAVDREAGEALRAAESRGAAVLLGDARAEPVLARARPQLARHVFCMTGDDGANVASALRIARLRASTPATAADPLRIFVRIGDPELSDALRRAPPFDRPPFAGVELSLFHPWASAARTLFFRHPLDLLAPAAIAGDRPVRIAILGFGGMGECIFRQAIRVSHFRTRRPIDVRILDRDPVAARRRIEARYPGLAPSPPAPAAVAARWEVEECAAEETGRLLERLAAHEPVDAFYACVPDESLAFAAAWGVQRAFPDLPVFVRSTQGAGHESLAGGPPAPPGRAPIPIEPSGQGCSAEAIAHDPLDEAARLLHESHRSAAGGAAAGGGIAPWESLATQYRDASRHAVDHLPAKLRAVGRTLAARGSAAPEPFSPADAERLAEIEHRRWCAERVVEGWSYAPRRDDARRRHPDLVEWSALPEASKAYDRNLVARIPELLGGLGLGTLPARPPE